jgi:leucyl aminopeptidase
MAKTKPVLPTSTSVSVTLSSRVPDKATAVAVFHAEGATPDTGLPAALQQAITRLISTGLFAGKSREVYVDALDNATRLIVVGLGATDKLTAESVRQAAGAFARAVRKYKLNDAAVILPALDKLAPEPTAGAVVTGLLLASFRYTEFRGQGRGRDADPVAPADVTLISPNVAAVREAVDAARAIAESQNFARTIAFRPGNVINPPSLARVAEDLAAAVGLTCRVMDERELKRRGMGGIFAVGSGSKDTPPRLIVLEHKPRVGKRQSKAGNGQPLLIVGKAITFDTGGISIKPAERMGKMVFDKCGGIAVLGAMAAVARLDLPVHVVGILSSAENHISESAYRPGDILRMYNGVTVEVTNTDAEGRLVLADALAWGIETYRPAAVIDLATLTGGVVVALGTTTAGVFANNDELFGEVSRSADRAGESLWRLPLLDSVRDLIKSDTADIVNSAGRYASPIQGAAFLSHFVPDGTPWMHMDIAGVADTDKDLPYYGKGATGWGVRTLVDWLSDRAKPVATHAMPRVAGG